MAPLQNSSEKNNSLRKVKTINYKNQNSQLKRSKELYYKDLKGPTHHIKSGQVILVSTGWNEK